MGKLSNIELYDNPECPVCGMHAIKEITGGVLMSGRVRSDSRRLEFVSKGPADHPAGPGKECDAVYRATGDGTAIAVGTSGKADSEPYLIENVRYRCDMCASTWSSIYELFEEIRKKMKKSETIMTFVCPACGGRHLFSQESVPSRQEILAVRRTDDKKIFPMDPADDFSYDEADWGDSEAALEEGRELKYVCGECGKSWNTLHDIAAAGGLVESVN